MEWEIIKVKLLNVFTCAIAKATENGKKIRKVWMTTFNIDIGFVEKYILPVLVDMECPRNPMDYEIMQHKLFDQKIDFRLFCDQRILSGDSDKLTTIPIHTINTKSFQNSKILGKQCLFHPKVILIENDRNELYIGAGSANLTISGWSKNQEVYSFHQVETIEQFKSIRLFFNTLINVVNNSQIPPFLSLSRFNANSVQKSSAEWDFVHTFLNKDFLNFILTEDTSELNVWSPYFSHNIPGLIELFKVNSPDLKSVKLVADKANGHHFRIKWSDAIAQMIQKNELTFYSNPLPQDERQEMTHAKVWQSIGKRTSRFAIGSWNFTHHGTASVKGKKNIEAGFVYHHIPKESILGTKIDVKNTHFADDQLLKDGQLDLKEPLPFLLAVEFDWKEKMYVLKFESLGNEALSNFQIKLPGIEQTQNLIFKYDDQQKIFLENTRFTVANDEAVLKEHFFQIFKSGDSIIKDIFTEINFEYRRAQRFDNLSDLIDSLVFEREIGQADSMSLRASMADDLDVEVFDDFVAAPQSNEITYFRMFLAFKNFENKILNSRNEIELYKRIFVYPGCLLELKEKVVDMQFESQIFQWFVLQEINKLKNLAIELYSKLSREDGSMRLEDWNQLNCNLPDILSKVKLTQQQKMQFKAYLQLVMKKQSYV